MRTIKNNGWAVALALVAVGVYGCSSQDSQQQQQAPTVQETTPPAAAPAAPAEPGAPAQSPADQPAAGAQEGVTPELIAQGQQVFTTTTCFTCHGPTGTGTPLAPNLTAGDWLNIENGTLEEIEQVVRTGVAQPVQFPAPMPPMGGAQLTDDQVKAVAAYVYSISRSKS